MLNGHERKVKVSLWRRGPQLRPHKAVVRPEVSGTGISCGEDGLHEDILEKWVLLLLRFHQGDTVTNVGSAGGQGPVGVVTPALTHLHLSVY